MSSDKGGYIIKTPSFSISSQKLYIEMDQLNGQ